MSITVEIKDGEGSGIVAGVRETKAHGNGVKVYSYEGNPLGFQSAFFINPEYGSNLNQNVTAGGTPDRAHDGIDSTLWTGSNVVGTKATFNSTDRAYAGTRSVKWDNPALNDIIAFDKGSNLTVSNYATLNIQVNIDKDWTVGDSIVIYGYDSGTLITVGVEIKLEDYINETSFDIWQAANIPLADMGLTSGTIDELRMMLSGKNGKAPKVYFDEIQFVETGTPIVFSAGPPKGKIWRVTNFTYIMSDAYSGVVLNGTMASIPYDGFLGVGTLANGTTVKRVQYGEARFTATFKDMIDYIATPAPKKVLSGSDGTNTWVRLEAEFPATILLDGDRGDRYEITINDDLSGLLYYRACLAYSEELKVI